MTHIDGEQPISDRQPPKLPSRTRTLPMLLSESSIGHPFAGPPPTDLPESVRIRRVLDEMSMVIAAAVPELDGRRARAREVESLTTTALQHRIAAASEETLDCYLDSLRSQEGIEVGAARATSTAPPPSALAAAASDPPAALEPEPATVRCPRASSQEQDRPREPGQGSQREVAAPPPYVRPRWARTVRLPPSLDGAPSTVRRSTLRRSAKARARTWWWVISPLLGAAVACAWFAFGASDADAFRGRGAPADAPPSPEAPAPPVAAPVPADAEPSLDDPAPAPEAERHAVPAVQLPAKPAPNAQLLNRPPKAAAPTTEAPSADRAEARERGVLSVSAEPGEAVYLDGRLVGWGPVVRLELEAHPYEVTVQRDGARTSSFVDVQPGHETKLRVNRVVR